MNHVERFKALMNFQPVDRLPMIEWAVWWDKTIDRWHGEGLPQNLTEQAEIRASLGLDPYKQLWIAPRGKGCPSPASHGAGICKNMDEYLKIHKFLYPNPAFDHSQFKQWTEAHKKGDLVIWISLDGYFWGARALLGIENHLYAFYDQPELMHKINTDLTEFNIRAYNEFCDNVCVPDFMTFGEDMSYNNGPMLSKQCFDDFLKPYYAKIVPVIKGRSTLAMVDSDGDVTDLIPWLEEVGLEGLLPYERRAGVDVAEIRRNHPKWRMIGAYDKTVMKDGEKAIREEFERLLPTAKKGGFIPSVDHQTPPDVSLNTYKVYVKLLKEYCTKAAQR